MHGQSGREEESRGLGHFVSVVRERWWVVVLAVVVLGAIAYGISSLLSPRYAATARLAYSADAAQLASQALSSAGTTQDAHNVANDALILQTPAFCDRVSKAMGGAQSPSELCDSIAVSADPEVDVIEVTATGPQLARVADIANAFANEFVAQRQQNAAASLLQAQELLEKRIEELTEEEAASAYGIALKQRYDDLTVLLSLGVKDYSVLQGAAAPTSAYFPKPFFNLGMGLLAGLVLGLLLAFMLDYLDRRIKSPATLERILELPVIGGVPLVSQKPKKASLGRNPAVGFGKGNEPLFESVSVLRSNLKALGFGDSTRSVLITSVTSDEGKSTLAVNLAIGMALAGDRVVLVDGDLRNPAIHQYLGIPNDRGLGEVLLDRDSSLYDKIQAVELNRFVPPDLLAARESAGQDKPVSRFVCLTSGATISNSSGVLEAGVVSEVLAELRGISDYVIVDGPPLLLASDAFHLAQGVDALVLASTLGRETAAEAAQVKEILDRAETTALGIVVFGAKPQIYETYHRDPYGMDQDEISINTG